MIDSILIRYVYFFFLLLLFSSCSGIKYITTSDLVSQSDIEEDILLLKSNLVDKHFDLNWENRQEEILKQLSLIPSSSELGLTVEEFYQKLDEIICTVDDGHTKVYYYDAIDKDDLPKKEENFSSIALDSNTLFIRIPNFVSTNQLHRSIDVLNDLSKNSAYERLIVDLRYNRGGRLNDVKYFLKNILESDSNLCMFLKRKIEPGVIGELRTLGFKILKSFKQSGDYLSKECKPIESNNNKHFKHRYVLVDSSVISGSMLAAYHLQKDGFKVVGEAPGSLVNTFGNIDRILLPKSKLYVTVSSIRLIVNENFNNREEDSLECDLQIKTNSIKEMLDYILLSEK